MLIKNENERERNINVKAVDTLVRLGFLVKADVLYYGRVNFDGSKWSADELLGDPSDRSILSTYPTIKVDRTAEIANRRARMMSVKEGGEPEVHEIVTSPNSYIVNVMFDESNLTEDQLREFKQALRVLVSFHISKFDPALFSERKYYVGIFKCIEDYMVENALDFCSNECLDKLCEEYIRDNPDILKGYGARETLTAEQIHSLFIKIGGGINSRKCCLEYPAYIINKFATQQGSNTSNVMRQTIDGKEILFPVSMQYIASWLSANGIVGTCGQMGNVASDEREMSYSLFDLSDISERREGDKLQSIMNECSAIAELLSNVTGIEGLDDFLRNGTPEEILEYFKDNEELAELYKVVPGHIWERFSIGEHTEAVLRGFESTFEDKIPPELLPFVKILMISHDLGKGLAGVPRYKEKEKNAEISKVLFERLGIPQNIQALMNFIVNESQTYTTDHYVCQNPNMSEKLRTLCAEKLEELFGKSSEELVTGLVRICEILQTCDSGAYTLYGITRDEKTGHYYYNGNANWTKGFKFPTDLAKRELHFDSPEM